MIEFGIKCFFVLESRISPRRIEHIFWGKVTYYLVFANTSMHPQLGQGLGGPVGALINDWFAHFTLFSFGSR